MAARVKHAIRWDNGMVMVLGDDGEQIPELQGKFEDVRQAVLDASDADTLFDGGSWQTGLGPLSRQEWATECCGDAGDCGDAECATRPTKGDEGAM